ncbi:MAG: molybdopterin dinucleotide binding domain-containing protein, partial [Xanthomonadales bacterium]|nr:molybdopterin dinucleotide binding domain-containing protein [Xanthomonadales bacterium]
RFTIHPTQPAFAAPGRLLMTTLRTHDQFNTTVYSENDRYRGISGSRRVLFINPDDLRAAQLTAGEQVDITSHFRDETRTVRGFRLVPYDIPRGCVASYYPETNDLVPIESYAQGSMTPAYKSVEVSLTPSRKP